MTRSGEPVVDDLGATVNLERAPERIASLVPSLTETIASWGLAHRLVGVTDWCVSPDLPGAARVRGTKNPDIAAVIDLAPDLVVANQEENRRVDVERLRAAGIAVYVTAPDTLADVADSLERLGRWIGAGEPAHRLAAEIRQALVDAGDSVPHDPGDGVAGVRGGRWRPLRTFCPVWRDPWIAVGSGTIAADLLHHAGFVVVPAEPRYPRVDLDDIAALDPDVVLLPDEPYEFGPSDAEVFAAWRAHVRLVDGAALTWWGPRTPAALSAFAAIALDLVASEHR